MPLCMTPHIIQATTLPTSGSSWLHTTHDDHLLTQPTLTTSSSNHPGKCTNHQRSTSAPSADTRSQRKPCSRRMRKNARPKRDCFPAPIATRCSDRSARVLFTFDVTRAKRHLNARTAHARSPTTRVAPSTSARTRKSASFAATSANIAPTRVATCYDTREQLTNIN